MKTHWKVVIVNDEKSRLELEVLLNDGWNVGVQQPTDSFVLAMMFKNEDTGIISPLNSTSTALGGQIKKK
jgi:hypothetical protein